MRLRRSPYPTARPRTLVAGRLLLLLIVLFVFGNVHAQEATFETPLVRSGPTALRGDDPGRLADEAVEMWLASETVTLTQLGQMDADAVCRELPALITAPPPPAGTVVDLTDRRERATDSEDRKRFTYAAEVPPDRLEVAEATLVRDGGAWRVERVGFQLPPTGGRSWLQSRQAGIGFVLASLLVVLALFRPSPLRRWLVTGRDAVRTHRRLVTLTMLGGWGIVALGLWSGAQLPDSCEQAVLVVLGTTLDQVGANAALASGDVARTALVIFYQNFFVVTLTVLFGSALLLGIPVYLIAGASFLAQSTAFGVLGLGTLPQLAIVAVLFLLEFTAYFLVVAGGGMLIATLVRGGLSELGNGYRKLAAMLPWAALLLLVGAWYEAVVLLI